MKTNRPKFWCDQSKFIGNSHNEKGDFSSSSSSDEEDTEKPLLLDLKEESFDGCSHETESPENGSGGPDREPKLDSFFQVRVPEYVSLQLLWL